MAAIAPLELFTNLELSEVVDRVADENPTWDTERLTTAVDQYKRWMYLCAIKPPGLSLGMGGSPGSKDVDEVWHAHLMFTRKYEKDCMVLCGKFLHHQPATKGNPGEKGSFRNTMDLYESTFKDRHPTWFGTDDVVRLAPDDCVSVSCQSDCQSDCGGCSLPCSSQCHDDA